MSPVKNIIGGALDGVTELAGKDEKVKMSALLRSEGFAEKDVPTMLAICDGESSKCKTKKGLNFAGCCVGCFQINVKAHFSWLKTMSGKSTQAEVVKWLDVPANNVKAAKRIHTMQGFNAWDAWKPGEVGQDFEVTTDENSPLGGAVGEVTGVATDVAKAGLAVPDFLLKLSKYLFDPGTYVRFGKGAGGAMFIIVGGITVVTVLIVKASKSPVGKAAVSVVPSPIKAAKVAKKVVT